MVTRGSRGARLRLGSADPVPARAPDGSAWLTTGYSSLPGRRVVGLRAGARDPRRTPRLTLRSVLREDAGVPVKDALVRAQGAAAPEVCRGRLLIGKGAPML
ncbi:hypothetical protein GCM10009844_09240 [Nocardioides koreensis]|uniref:Uncharacterized protein n=1 Tax=Nocardioides koreensis TaxID=433651 RepID=A0ABN2ZC44_9ACTN